MRRIALATTLFLLSVGSVAAQDVTSPTPSASSQNKSGTQTIPPAGKTTSGLSNPSGSGTSTSGGKDDNPSGLVRCANKRSAVWCALAQWLKAGAIPNDPELKAQLTGPEYSENAQGIVLERKEDMRARGLGSPDIADALALTFASPVWTTAMSGLAGPGDHLVVSEYSPFSDEALSDRPLPESTRRYTAPGWPRLKSDEWSQEDFADAFASDALRNE